MTETPRAEYVIYDDIIDPMLIAQLKRALLIVYQHGSGSVRMDVVNRKRRPAIRVEFYIYDDETTKPLD